MGFIVLIFLICLVPLSYFIDVFAPFIVGIISIIPLIEAVIYTSLLEKEEKQFRSLDSVDEEGLENSLQEENKRLKGMKARLFDQQCQYEALKDFVKEMDDEIKPLLKQLDFLIEQQQPQSDMSDQNKVMFLERN